MGDFTLVLSRNQFSCERQADAFPTLGLVDKEVRQPLMPHSLVVNELIADRTIEVLLIHQQLVAGSSEVVLYQVTEYRPVGCCTNAAIWIAAIVVATICWLGEIGGQHTVCLCIAICCRSINQQVVSLIAVDDAGEAVLIEQWTVEQVYSSGSTACTTDSPIGIVMTSKVDSRHIRVSRMQVYIVRRLRLRVGYEVHSRVEVSHIHHL